MSAMSTLPWEDRPRAAPLAMIYVGVPAYVVIAAFSIGDLVRSHEPFAAAVGVAAVLAFSGVFLGFAFPLGHPRSERFVLRYMGTMAVLAVAIVLLGTTTAVYPAVVSAMAGDSLRPARAMPFIIGMSVVAGVSSIANGLGLEDAITEPAIVLMVGLFTLAIRRLAETNRELSSAREELAGLAVASERLRFARDLHDLLGHSLTVIRAKSELASRLARSDVGQAIREMEEVEVVARSALAEVRETVTGYRRPTLLSEVAKARAVLETAGIDVVVTVGRCELSDEVDETLGWVLREAVTNVVRHSGATECHIETSEDDGVIRLRIVDDGGGAASGPGNGLVGARERLSIVGGSLDAGSGASGGFQLEARVPGPS
jgi:two-component system sensor histidine kinase DesK